ncbi:MAG: AraC family transcriptional regulator [Lachnospiraceae bacterium]|nr:AraC family transcriptional regulator [Lachnospiraceae bacterium]
MKENAAEKIAYKDLNISFVMENEPVYVGNIVFECFHRSIPMHAHSDNSYEIHYISGGHGQVTVEGQEYEVVPNILYITGPHIQHSMIPDASDPLSEYCVYLKLSDHSKRSANLRSPMHLFRDMMVWYGMDRHRIHALMRMLFEELEEKNLGYRMQVESLLKQLIIACVRNYTVETKEGELSGQRSLDHQFLTIEEAFLYEYGTLTLTDLSDRLHLSTRQTQRLLLEHYGMNFQSKKTEARMSAAALLLRSKEITITQIADAVGYSSVEHFSSAFRRYFGVSASRYRTKMQEKGGKQNGTMSAS